MCRCCTRSCLEATCCCWRTFRSVPILKQLFASLYFNQICHRHVHNEWRYLHATFFGMCVMSRDICMPRSAQRARSCVALMPLLSFALSNRLQMMLSWSAMTRSAAMPGACQHACWLPFFCLVQQAAEDAVMERVGELLQQPGAAFGEDQVSWHM